MWRYFDKSEPEIHISELISALNLDLDRLVIEPDTGETLNHSFDIDSAEFLKFAEIDLMNGDKRGLINSLSNAKRAIDCQTDKVLACFGLLSRHNFPQKMDLLRSMGIIAPRIVNKVVKARNYLEHEYIIPDKNQVEDAIDIANLFVVSLDRSLHFFPTSFGLGTVVDGVKGVWGDTFKDKELGIGFDVKNPRFGLKGYITHRRASKNRKRQVVIGQSILTPKDKGFTNLVKLALGIEQDSPDLETQVRELLVFLSAK